MNLGPYRILERIGRGGMATVYKAYQPSLDRYVAVKVLPAHLTDEPDFAQRFKREARSVAMLEHPHILPVYDYGQEEDLTYIVIRYVESGTLKQHLGKPLELLRVAHLIGQVAEALHHAHEHGVVHRDVKPSNVLLDHDDWALLTDFGVAWMVEATQQLTATGVGVGTPAYMSPEQGQGKKVDRRSDMYSLGVMLYEMMTGRVPYEADTPLAVVLKHINEPLPLPSEVNPSVPEGVQLVVLKAMAKDPEDRYRTAGAMAEALREAVREAEAIGPYPIGEKPKQDVVAEVPARTRDREGLRKLLRPLLAFARRSGRRRVWAWVMGTFAVLGVVLIGVLAWTGSFEGRKPSPTEAAQLAIAATSPSSLEPASTEAPPSPGNTPGPATPTEISLSAAPILTYVEGEVLFEDDFETGFARNWSRLDESFIVFQEETGNYLLQSGTTGGWGIAIAGDASWQDYAVEFRMKVLEISPEALQTREFALFAVRSFAVSDRCAGYAIQIHADIPVAGGISRGITREDGECEYTRLDTSNTLGLAQDQWYSLRIEAKGARIDVYLDGQLVLSGEDSDPILSGQLSLEAPPGVTIYYDDVRVIELVPAET